MSDFSRHEKTHLNLPPVASDLEKAKLEVQVLRQFMAENMKTLDTARKTVQLLKARNHRLQDRVEDLSEREKNARRMANHDGLTGLPNRRLLTDRLHQAMHMSARKSDEKVAVLFLDLNGFKAVNDNYGHQYGDILLKEVALRLRQCLRAMDTACRYGGDEFVVLLPNVKSTEYVGLVADRVRDSLAKPYLVEGRELRMTVSIGFSVYPDQASDPAALVHRADISMYARKMALRNQV